MAARPPRQGLLWDARGRAWKKPSELEPKPPARKKRPKTKKAKPLPENVIAFPKERVPKKKKRTSIGGGYIVETQQQLVLTGEGEDYVDRFVLYDPDGVRVGLPKTSLEEAKFAASEHARSKVEATRADIQRAWMKRPLVLERKAPKKGDTIESPAWRLHRYATSIRLWDLKNAGKRGKKVRELMWWALDRAPAKVRPSIEKAIDLIANTTTFDEAAAIVEEWFSWNDPEEIKQPMGGKAKRAQNTEYKVVLRRGIDVPAAGERKFQFVTPELAVDVTAQDFSIRDLRDRANMPAAIPPLKRKKTAIKKMYKWFGENEERVRRMKYRELLNELNAAGIEYHSYLMMD
jgi:hypothetical protein